MSGRLFEETLQPLKKYPNVKIQEGFLTHTSNCNHKSYGIFMTPTRMDSQGVSRARRCLGISSNYYSVTAIPEFVDDDCGMLVDSEDYKGMAKAIPIYTKTQTYFQN